MATALQPGQQSETLSQKRKKEKENMVHIHNGVLFSLKKISLSFAATWIELEVVMLSEISQAQKNKYHTFSHMWELKK